jgi:hypothetical protein
MSSIKIPMGSVTTPYCMSHFSTLKTKAASGPEVVYFLPGTWHHISEDSFLQNKAF